MGLVIFHAFPRHPFASFIKHLTKFKQRTQFGSISFSTGCKLTVVLRLACRVGPENFSPLRRTQLTVSLHFLTLSEVDAVIRVLPHSYYPASRTSMERRCLPWLLNGSFSSAPGRIRNISTFKACMPTSSWQYCKTSTSWDDIGIAETDHRFPG